jgi:hypothetical protein
MYHNRQPSCIDPYTETQTRYLHTVLSSWMQHNAAPIQPAYQRVVDITADPQISLNTADMPVSADELSVYKITAAAWFCSRLDEFWEVRMRVDDRPLQERNCFAFAGHMGGIAIRTLTESINRMDEVFEHGDPLSSLESGLPLGAIAVLGNAGRASMARRGHMAVHAVVGMGEHTTDMIQVTSMPLGNMGIATLPQIFRHYRYAVSGYTGLPMPYTDEYLSVHVMPPVAIADRYGTTDAMLSDAVRNLDMSYRTP